MGSPPRHLKSPARRLAVVGSPPRRPRQIAWVNSPPFRLLLVWIILCMAAGGLAMNLFRLQIKQGAELREIAQTQQMLYLRPFIPRRQIVDRTGTVLALDRPVFTLFAHPKLFKEPKEAIAEKIAPLINRPPADLVKRFGEAESGLEIATSLSEDVSDRITELRTDGLELIQRQQRLYPQQELTADVVGYVNDDHKGQAGIELSQQNLLQRVAKDMKLRRTGDGSILPDQVPGGFLNLDDLQLQLTIDTRLQRVALGALQKQVKQFSAKRGVVIVMDAQDGSLLSLVSTPSYDPNQYFKYPLERFKNWAITDLYEPGSTFKPINVAIALEAKAITPTTTLVDEGQITVDGWPIQNFDYSSAGGRGEVSITEIVQYSSNVGMVHIVNQMKPPVFYNWLHRLGLGKLTGIDLPAEVEGHFKDRKTFLEAAVERATTAFGQGFSLTPIQLTQLHGTLANGGRLVTPHLVKGLFDSKGQAYWQPNFPPPRQLFSKTTTQAVLPMMEKVVQDGTGKSAQIPGYRLGGKTGTAQKANPNGGYYENAKITSFVSIFPIDAPRYVVVAVVDEPQGGDAFGSTVAAPIVKTVIEALIAMERIPPSVNAPGPQTETDDGG